MLPEWLGSAIMQFGWVILAIRSALALVAGWGLMERTQWGRVVAIVAAFFNLLKFPFGTALGVWTLIVLLGYRNATLYDALWSSSYHSAPRG
jgi:predicted membrane chloride channel (bestrophin family)